MKKLKLVRMLERAGFVKEKNSGRGPHEKYIRGQDRESVPRHSNIDDTLARAIIRRWGLK